jgi:hypothetical protein
VSAVPEAASGLAFFLSALRAGTTSPGGVQIGEAKVGTPFPCIIVAFQSGIDVIYANAKRAFIDALYQVKAVGVSADPDAIIVLASQIDASLGGDEGLSHVDVTGGHILSCYRQSPLLYNDQDKAGTQFMHLGGLWRIQNQQKP